MEVFDIANPRYNEQISPVPCHFVKSRFHCIIIIFTLVKGNFLTTLAHSFRTLRHLLRLLLPKINSNMVPKINAKCVIYFPKKYSISPNYDCRASSNSQMSLYSVSTTHASSKFHQWYLACVADVIQSPVSNVCEAAP